MAKANTIAESPNPPEYKSVQLSFIEVKKMAFENCNFPSFFLQYRLTQTKSYADKNGIKMFLCHRRVTQNVS